MISPDHLAMLAASGITPEHAMARGCETITVRRRLEELGFVKAACRCVPGLLIPMLRADGSTWGHQYRPDIPRWRGDRQVKYETPYQQRNGLDIPPGMEDLIGDPSVPLWVTEGVKKALQNLELGGSSMPHDPQSSPSRSVHRHHPRWGPRQYRFTAAR